MKKADAQFLRAKQLIQAGDALAATSLLKKITKKDKHNFEAWFLLGNLAGSQQRHREAQQAFAQVIAINAQIPEAHHNLALSLIQQQQGSAAIAPLKTALKLNPAYDAAYANLISVLDKAGRFTEALQYLEQWLSVRPENGAIYLQGGILAQANNDYSKAQEFYQQAIAVGLQDYSLFLNYGVVLQHLSCYHEALAQFERALQLNSNCAITRYNMAGCYASLGEFDKAAEWAQQALAIMPSLIQARSMLLFNLNYRYPYDAAQVYQKHLELVAPLVDAAATPSFENTPEPARRLRIGYVSEGFHNHPIAFFMEPILATHDREQVEVFCYADLPHPDETSARLRQLALQWRDIAGLDNQLFQRQVAQDGIDILVDLDGYTSPKIERFVRRNAPVQVSYLGYPNTLGLPTVDYRLTDGWVDPEGLADQYYSEKLLRLGDCFFCYSPPGSNIEVNALPAGQGEAFTFGSFNKQEKINPHVLALWAKILAEVPASRLMLQNKAVSSAAGQAQVRAQFAAHGIAEERLQFAPYGDFASYLAAHHAIDLMLDTFPWNGHTNTCHGLWMGVPTLTITGDFFAGRFGLEIMHHLGYPEFVAENETQYVDKAKALAENLTTLAAMRGQLREQLLASPLCQPQMLTQQIEQQFRRIWRNWCTG